MKFGEKIRTARLSRNLSQEELAKATGVSKRTIINYESGQRTPKRREVYNALSEALDIPVDNLMDDTAEFIIDASEAYGERGRKQAEQLIEDVSAFYAGGTLSPEDLDAMNLALQEAYWKAKKINRKFVPKKFQK